ncbi:MAG TPA: DUF5667 domain-containing protein [Anaerolineales bacterium]|nr:DUF5667 domain-containing protein [Anaerolineales bacterium]
MNDQNDFETKIMERLNEIKTVPPRNQQAASRGRALFLNQAVSASESLRHKGWISKFRKEHFAMNAILSTLLILGLLFGGGATVNAAQDDLPNEPLYELKLWTEDLGLRFQNNDEAKVTHLMELTRVRVQEMIQMVEAGEVIPDQVQLRLEQHVQLALQTCTNMDDATLERALLQIRNRLQQQDQEMQKLQLQTQDQAQLLERIRTMLRQRLQLVEDGLANPDAFRNQAQNNFRYGQDEDVTPPAQNGNGQQNGQPTLTPAGPNTEPDGPNINPGEPNTDPGGPNTDPGGPNSDPGGPNTDPGGNNNDSSGSGSGGDGNGAGSTNNNGTGGNGK